jgi:dihydropyrimidinase
MPDYDLIIRGGTVVTASDQFRADVGIRAGRIAALAEHLDAGPVFDAAGLLVLPGGVDGHCHIEQLQQGGGRTRRPSPREAGLPWRAAPRRS